MDYKVIGTRPIRHDGTDKVTGQAVYGVDVTLPGVLCGKVLRSPHAHARIRSIDISRAEGYEGVKAVIVGEDLQAPNLLAVGKVLFDGHGVAAVAAVNAQVAEEALELIEVEYEVLTPVAQCAAGDAGRCGVVARGDDDGVAGGEDGHEEQYCQIFPAYIGGCGTGICGG